MNETPLERSTREAREEAAEVVKHRSPPTTYRKDMTPEIKPTPSIPLDTIAAKIEELRKFLIEEKSGRYQETFGPFIVSGGSYIEVKVNYPPPPPPGGAYLTAPTRWWEIEGILYLTDDAMVAALEARLGREITGSPPVPIEYKPVVRPLTASEERFRDIAESNARGPVMFERDRELSPHGVRVTARIDQDFNIKKLKSEEGGNDNE